MIIQKKNIDILIGTLKFFLIEDGIVVEGFTALENQKLGKHRFGKEYYTSYEVMDKKKNIIFSIIVDDINKWYMIDVLGAKTEIREAINKIEFDKMGEFLKKLEENISKNQMESISNDYIKQVKASLNEYTSNRIK